MGVLDRFADVDKVIDTVRTVAYTHSHVWMYEHPDFWLRRIMAELGEASESLDGRHKHAITYELVQVAAITINLLAKLVRCGYTLPDAEQMYKDHMAKYEPEGKSDEKTGTEAW